MYTIHVDLIDKNPWQPRQDMGEIVELAHDILHHRKSRPDTLGLLQRPAVRLLNSQGNPVTPRYFHKEDELEQYDGDPNDLTLWMRHKNYRAQIVYGHRRKQAFDDLQFDDEAYSRLPVEVVFFNDEEMARTAWTENEARKNLSAVEEAYFIQQLMEEFNWTHEEIGEHLSMARPTVTNRLRLLRLPEELQQAQIAGNISARKAEAILPIMELPDVARKKADEPDYPWYTSTADLLEMAHDQEVSSDKLRETVHGVINDVSVSLEDIGFPLDHEFTGRGLQSKACNSCPVLIRQGNLKYCPHKICMQRKKDRWRKLEEKRASKELEIPILVLAKGKTYSEVSDSIDGYYDEHRRGFKIAQEDACERLHLRDGHPFRPLKRNFPTIEFRCKKVGNKQCKCIAAGKKALAKEREEKLAAGEEDTRSEWQIEHELAKKLRPAIEDKIIRPGAQALVKRLIEDELSAWQFIYKIISSDYREREGRIVENPQTKEEYLLDIVFAELWDDLTWKASLDIRLARLELAEYLRTNFKLEVDALEHSDADRLLEKFEEIRTWFDGTISEQPSLEQLQGTIDDLTTWVSDAGNDAEISQEAIDEAGTLNERLLAAKAALEVPGWGASGRVEMATLVQVSPGDVSFKETLQVAIEPEVMFALAHSRGLRGNKTRNKKLRTRRDKLRAVTA